MQFEPLCSCEEHVPCPVARSLWGKQRIAMRNGNTMLRRGLLKRLDAHIEVAKHRAEVRAAYNAALAAPPPKKPRAPRKKKAVASGTA